MDANQKVSRLVDYFKRQEGVLIAFSGGVDSTVLAKAAQTALGEKAIAVTLDSPLAGPLELKSAEDAAREIGIKHMVVSYDALEDTRFMSNPPDRCYLCKKRMMAKLKDIAASHGIACVAEGTNAEEVLRHRPGYKAVEEAGAITPLADLGYLKADVREMATYMGLSNAKKPSNACLASRIPYGTTITEELLERIAKAETIVRNSGTSQVRVRSYGELAVIEVDSGDNEKVMAQRARIFGEMKALGYKRVALDLEGYSTGSMDR